MKTVKNFQSYLFIGSDHPERLKNIDVLLKTLGTNRNANSPDLTVIEPVKNSIGIAQIRELKKKIFQKPSVEILNTVIIKNADKLTPEAQNSLLKLIEEPPDKAIIILEGETKSSFLPTVLSRVVIQNITNPNDRVLQKGIESPDLDQILEITDPNEWLSEQIQLRYFQLLGNFHNYKTQSAEIEKLATVKKMISANVNPKFLLASLFFSQNK